MKPLKLRLTQLLFALRLLRWFVLLCATCWFAGFGFLCLMAGELREAALVLLLAVCVCPVWEGE